MEFIIWQWKSKGGFEMKKAMAILICMSIMLMGCVNSNTVKQTKKNETTEFENTTQEETIQEHKINANAAGTSGKNETKRMVMLRGKLYVDTGEKGMPPTCGVMDFSFDKTTDKVPTKNGQTNFGKGYKGQYYLRNRIIIMINNQPCVFAFQENDLEGVTMYVKNFSKKKAEICIENLSETEWECDEKFELERFNVERGAWQPVNTVIGDAAFNDKANMLSSKTTSNITVEWEWLYGTLEKGKYRIVKELNPAPYLSIAQGAHTYTAQFEISK